VSAPRAASIVLLLALQISASAGGPRWHPPLLPSTHPLQRSTQQITMFKKLSGYPPRGRARRLLHGACLGAAELRKYGGFVLKPLRAC